MLIFLFLNHFVWAQGPLQGRWVQSCQTQAVREESFQGAQASLTEFYYYRPACSEPLMEIRNQGTFEADSTYLDFTFQKVTITLRHSLMLEDFNSRNVCGFSDWKMDEEKEVTGLECALITGARALKIPAVGSKRYGIYKIKGDLLYFGRLEPGHDALSPEKRPITLDPRFYVKQP